MKRTIQINETAAMLLIGDGVLGMLHPTEHCNVWRTSHDGQWNAALTWFATHPSLVRGFALAEIAAGLWLAHTQLQSPAVRTPAAVRITPPVLGEAQSERHGAGAGPPAL
jgi:hypothetical protein